MPWPKGKPAHNKGKGKAFQFVERALRWDNDECLEWPYYSESGYGRLQHNGKIWSAHRLVLTMAKGEAPEAGMYACHMPVICHNRLCVNPAHLYWGTPSENASDRAKDGTSQGGEANYGSVLTEESVRSIWFDKRTYRVIANAYGCHSSMVSRIKNRQCWQSVTDAF